MSEPLTNAERVKETLRRWNQGIAIDDAEIGFAFNVLLAENRQRDGEIAALRAETGAINETYAARVIEIDGLLGEREQQAQRIAELKACRWELVYNADNTDWDYEWCQGEHNELIARARKLSKGKELAESGEEVRDDEA